MNTVRRIAVGGTLSVALLAMVVAGVVTMTNWRGHPHGQAGGRAEAIAVRQAAITAGSRDPRAITCGGQGPVIGEVGVLRPGAAAAARASYGRLALADLNDSASGRLMFFRAAPGATAAWTTSYFTRVGAVHAQSSVPALHTCDMLLSNRPAAQPLVTAALRAAVSDGLAASVRGLRGKLQEVLVSNNPLRPGSVIVTLLLPGPARRPIYKGAPSTHSLEPVTVVMSYPGARVSGVARGGL